MRMRAVAMSGLGTWGCHRRAPTVPSVARGGLCRDPYAVRVDKRRPTVGPERHERHEPQRAHGECDSPATASGVESPRRQGQR